MPASCPAAVLKVYSTCKCKFNKLTSEKLLYRKKIAKFAVSQSACGKSMNLRQRAPACGYFANLLSMEQQQLSKSMVANPRVWRLAMRLDRDALQVMLYSPIEDNSMIYRSIPLAQSAQSPLRALEDAVYDNPLLLSDFERVYLLAASQPWLLVPTEAAADADDCEALMAAAYPDHRLDPVLSCDTGTPDATLLLGMEPDLAGFINRTFLAVRISHPIAALSRYFAASISRGNTIKTMVNLHSDRLDIISIDRGKLLLANTFRYQSTDDALYYTLACRQSLQLADSDEIFLSGDAKAREALMPRLRQYVPSVMPMIFPSQMFSAGRQAMNVPFDLIVMPLCE